MGAGTGIVEFGQFLKKSNLREDMDNLSFVWA